MKVHHPTGAFHGQKIFIYEGHEVYVVKITHNLFWLHFMLFMAFMVITLQIIDCSVTTNMLLRKWI